MASRIQRIALSMFVCLTFLSAGFAQVLLKEGDPAPQFALEDAHGKMFQLGAHQGKIVIMGFVRKAENKEDGQKRMSDARRWLVELDTLFGNDAAIIEAFLKNMNKRASPGKTMINKEKKP